MSDTKIGFVTITEADDYFSTRLGAGDYWNSSAPKSAALMTAYNQIMASNDFANIVENENSKKAQCEQALFLLAFGNSIFRRKSLQTQGVVRSDVVGETYNQGSLDEIPICVMARSFLKEFEKGSSAKIITLTRNEAEEE